MAAIGKALKEINADGVKMTLDIYSQEKLTNKQLEEIAPNEFIRVNSSVTANSLVQIYKEADIALHVESFDKKYRYATRVSFSTKIIDLMAYSCAIMAICWERHAGYQYLKSNDIAFCVSEINAINSELLRICNNPALIQTYALKACDFGILYNNRSKIQSQIQQVFRNTINV